MGERIQLSKGHKDVVTAIVEASERARDLAAKHGKEYCGTIVRDGPVILGLSQNKIQVFAIQAHLVPKGPPLPFFTPTYPVNNFHGKRYLREEFLVRFGLQKKIGTMVIRMDYLFT